MMIEAFVIKELTLNTSCSVTCASCQGCNQNRRASKNFLKTDEDFYEDSILYFHKICIQLLLLEMEPV